MNLSKKTTNQLVFASVLFIIGIVAYVVMASGTMDSPNRIMYDKPANGKVLFDHAAHAAEDGYGLVCRECHHTLEEDTADPSEIESCGACHEPESEDLPKREEAFHTQCKGCHEGFAGPVECNACHVLQNI